MTDSVVDVLVKARALIELPENWCQLRFIYGERRCAARAISDAAGRDYELADAALNACGYRSMLGLAGFNDTRTHSEVLDLFTRAIEVARAEQERANA